MHLKTSLLTSFEVFQKLTAQKEELHTKKILRTNKVIFKMCNEQPLLINSYKILFKAVLNYNLPFLSKKRSSHICTLIRIVIPRIAHFYNILGVGTCLQITLPLGVIHC